MGFMMSLNLPIVNFFSPHCFDNSNHNEVFLDPGSLIQP